ncbi:FAD-dependent oxidoreductase [Candidatus Kaiserbacteria bacterium]|nr:FAD-dependent oxidoreductase [Candidatus Kaiserbacteria bacterium]
MQYDLIIIGGGPAGSSAAVYAARKRLKTLMVVEEWGGQSAISSEIQNWIGTPQISGADLADNLKKHVAAYVGDSLEVKNRVRATSLETRDDGVTVTLSNGEKFETKTALITTGANRRTLDVPGAAEYDQKGLTYCASCDGPLFADKDVAVIGGGNAAFETALQLLAYCKNVTLLNRSDSFRADEITVSAAPQYRVDRLSTRQERRRPGQSRPAYDARIASARLGSGRLHGRYLPSEQHRRRRCREGARGHLHVRPPRQVSIRR